MPIPSMHDLRLVPGILVVHKGEPTIRLAVDPSGTLYEIWPEIAADQTTDPESGGMQWHTKPHDPSNSPFEEPLAKLKAAAERVLSFPPARPSRNI